MTILACSSSLAGDAIWSGGTGIQAWSDGANWSTSPLAPGATSGTTNPDSATFNTATAGTSITIDPNRNIKNLIFGSTVAGNYTIGSAGANAGESLLLSSGGKISITSGYTAPVIVNAPLIIEPTGPTGTGTYTFENNATAGDADTNPYKLTINGNITGGTTSSSIQVNFNSTAGNRSNDASANIVNGLISDGLSGGVAVSVTGSSTGQRGVWRFNNNANSYTGNTTVTAGTLIFTSMANSGVNSAIGAGNTLTFSGGSHVKYVGGAATTNRTINGNGAAFYNNGTGALTLTGSVTTGFTFRGSQNFIVEGLISGAAGVTRTDSGTVFLNNNNNAFTGDIAISDGAIQAGTISNNGSNSAIGSNGRIMLGQGSATIGRFEYSGVTNSTDRLIVMRNDAAGSTGRGKINVMTAGETLTFTGGVRVNSAVAANIADLELLGSGNGVISGVIGGTTASAGAIVSMKITKTGTGIWTLSGANTYARETLVSQGILNVQHSTALGAILSNEAVPTSVGAGTTVSSGATLQLQNNISIGAEILSLAGTGATGQNGALVNVSGTNNYAGALTFTANTTIASDSGRLNLTNTTAIVGSGGSRTLTLAGAGDGSLASNMDTGVSSVTKNGTGLWTLSGANTYTGTTVINAGTLNVTGSLGNTAVTANTGATFAYGGTLSNSLTVANNATLVIGDVESPGSTGTLTVGGVLTLNNDSVLKFDLGTSSDRIQANGVLTLNGILQVTPGAGFTAGSYRLFDYTSTFTDNILMTQGLAGYDLAVDVATPNQVHLVATAISAQYWDGNNTTANGIVDGGNGVWTNAGTNWTTADGSTNGSWAGSTEKIAVFGGASGGTVQVQDSVDVNGLQIAGNYTLTNAGGAIQIANANTEVRVDPTIVANIATPVTGLGGINKTGDGTLIVSATAGQNTYTGGTLITSGTLKIGANNALPTTGAVTMGAGSLTSNLDVTAANQQIASLSIVSNNALLNNTVTIGAGQTLTIAGTGSLKIGIANTAKAQTRAVFTGAGALVVNNVAGNLELGIQTASVVVPGGDSPADNTSNTNKATVDFSGLGSLSATVNEFRVGYGLNINSTVTLSNMSNLINANTVQVGNSNNGNAGTGGNTLILGSGTNVFQTNTLNIGVSKAVSTLGFASQTAGSAGTVVIGGKSVSTTNIVVGSTLGTATGATPTGTLDLRGHIATITANNLIISQRNASGAGGATGTVYFDGGTFTANTVSIGSMSGDAAGTSNGQLIVTGGTLTVNSGGSFTLTSFANTTASGFAKGTLTLTGGTLISNADILEVANAIATVTNTVSTLTLNGGTLDMTGHNIGDATNTINTLTLASGTLKDVGEINGGAAINKTTAGTLILQGTNAYSGPTTVSAGTLLVNNTYSDLSSATGSNNVSVSNVAILGGQGRIAGNVSLAGGATLAPGGNATSIAANTSGLNTDVGTMQIVGDLTVASAATIALQLKTNGTHGLTPVYSGSDRITAVSGTSLDGGNDRVIVNGVLSLDPASNTTVNFGLGYAPAYHDVFDLLDWVGTTIPTAYYDDGDGIRAGGATDNSTYALDLPDLTGYNSSWFWDVSLFGSTGVVAIVPEPSRCLLLMSGLIVLLMRRRREDATS